MSNELPLTYEEFCQWRNICEWLSQRPFKQAMPHTLVQQFGAEIESLVAPDRTRRQILWDNYQIQFIFWNYEDGRWQLRQYWEDKIDFLEQVYVLNRNPNALPKPWLEKQAKAAQIKERTKWWRGFDLRLRAISSGVDRLSWFLPQESASPIFSLDEEYGQRQLAGRLEQILEDVRFVRSQIRELPTYLGLAQPDPGAVVLGGLLNDYPLPSDAVLGRADPNKIA